MRASHNHTAKMNLRLTLRRTAFSAAAGALIAATSLLTTSVAHAASNSAALDALLPLMAKAAAGARMAPSATVVLPTPTGPARPFRKSMVGDCKFDSPLPNLSGYKFCKFPAIAVAENRLLEIKNVSCLILPHEGVLLLSTSGNVARLFNSLVGIVISGTSSPQGGPIYVAPGERLFVWGFGQPDSPAFCTVHGLLSPIG